MDDVGAPAGLRVERPVRLSGNGLVLREWAEGDLAAMVELFHDPDIAFRTPLPSPFTLREARARLDRAAQPDLLLLAVTLDGGRPRGEVLLKASGELGYMIGALHRRRGLAGRALLLLREYAYDVARLAAVRLEIEPDNEASVAVARAAGFVLERPAAHVVEDKGRQVCLDVWGHVRS